MLEINPEKLIKAVKARPALYKKTDTMYYSHRKHKERLWRDVCSEVYPNWEGLKPVDKVECARDMQKRWKSLRTCFTRELGFQRKERFKVENSIPFRKRKRYGYFEAMSFLLGDNPEQFELKDSDDDGDPLDGHLETTDVDFSFNDTNNEEVSLENITEAYELPAFDKSEELENKVYKVIKDIKRDEDDDDRQFVMSLIPMFRKLTDRQKIEARIEVMKVLQKISFEDEPKNTQYDGKVLI